jgi:hypothetical protein
VISIRGGSGLGDSIYLQSVARHLAEQGNKVEVCSNWPEVFSQIPVKVSPFRRDRINKLAHYSAKKYKLGTTQFQDCCHTAGVDGIDLNLHWQQTTTVDLPKPYVCVQLPRSPMGRTDGFGADLLPDCRRIQQAINLIRGRATVVQIGAGKSLFDFDGIDIDLANKTTVTRMFDIATEAPAFVGYVSFIVPLAEAVNKRALLVWSRKGLRGGHQYVRAITPAKVLHKPSSRWVIDNCNDATLEEEVNALF